MNRVFMLFGNHTDKTFHTGYYLLKIDIRDYNVMIDGRNFFDKTVKYDIRTLHWHNN